VLPLSLMLVLVGCSVFPVEPDTPPSPSVVKDPACAAAPQVLAAPLWYVTATGSGVFNAGETISQSRKCHRWPWTDR
jgi:hypothetical protein